MFKMDQEYNIGLELTLPINDANMAVGNFMITIDLMSSHGASLYKASRPILLTPEPRPMRWVSRAARLITHPSPAEPIAALQRIHVPLLHRALPRPSTATVVSLSEQFGGDFPSYTVATHAHVSVGRADSALVLPDERAALHTNTHGEVQVQNAVLFFRAHLTGIPYVNHLHESPDSAAITCTTTQSYRS